MFVTNSQKVLAATALFFDMGTAQADVRNIPALRMSELFFERCVPLILNEQTLTGYGLDPLPRETVLSIGATTGRAWMPFDAHVSLSDLKSSDQRLYGCQVRWHSFAAAGRGSTINFDQVIDAFNAWADEEVSLGTLAAIKQCGDRNAKYLRVVESRTERDQPVRFALSYDRSIDFIFLIAGETGVVGEEETC